MKQLLPRVQQNISYASVQDFWSVNDGGVGSKLSSTFGSSIARIPLPWAVTVRNLVLASRDTRTQGIAVTLLKNNSVTALTNTLPAGSDGPITVSGIDVSYAALDDFSYRTNTGIGESSPGKIIGWAVEAESAGNIFGISATWGSYAATQGAIGGALGNGFWQSYDSTAPYSRSTSYSICATPGDLTVLALKTFGAAPAVGSSWIGYYILNGVVQDGAGDTVDTRTEITAGNTTALSTFVLPIVKGDDVEVAFYRTGATSASETGVAVGVGFIPTTDGMFMLTGGSNDVVATPTGYVWIHSAQNETSEGLAMAPIGPSGLVGRGLYVERGAPGTGATLTNTVRRNEGGTVISVTLADDETSGLIDDQFVPFFDGDGICLESAGVGDPNPSSRLYWGLEASVAVGLTPPSERGVIGPHIFIRKSRRQPGT